MPCLRPLERETCTRQQRLLCQSLISAKSRSTDLFQLRYYSFAEYASVDLWRAASTNSGGASHRLSECASSAPSSNILRLPTCRASSRRSGQLTVVAAASTQAKSQICARVIQQCLEPWLA